MPKAFLQTRSSGVYARFLVPQSLRARWGRQYVVRALRERGDAARLSAAQLGYALGQAFAAAKGQPMDTKKLITDVLAAHEAGALKHYTVAHTPGGGVTITADGADDHARAMEALAALSRLPSPSAPLLIPVAAVPAPLAKPMLSLNAAIELFLKQFGQKQRAASNILDTTHTLRILTGVVDDKPVADVDAQDMDLFLDAIGHLAAQRDEALAPTLGMRGARQSPARRFCWLEPSDAREAPGPSAGVLWVGLRARRHRAQSGAIAARYDPSPRRRLQP